jgi:GFO/IDH/MocA oxidoreductase family protein
MKLATAPVNWNNADVTDYRPWVPYPALLDEMVAAGYVATEWGMNMERETANLRSDLQQRKLQMLGGFVGLELRNRQKRDAEIARAVEIGRFFQSAGGGYLTAADSGDDRRRAEAGHVDPSGALTNELTVSREFGARYDHYENFPDRFEAAYRLELHAFFDALRAGQKPSPGAEDALETLRLAIAAARSWKENRPIKVSEIQP